jgi:hypothetical protein
MAVDVINLLLHRSGGDRVGGYSLALGIKDGESVVAIGDHALRVVVVDPCTACRDLT